MGSFSLLLVIKTTCPNQLDLYVVYSATSPHEFRAINQEQRRFYAASRPCTDISHIHTVVGMLSLRRNTSFSMSNCHHNPFYIFGPATPSPDEHPAQAACTLHYELQLRRYLPHEHQGMHRSGLPLLLTRLTCCEEEGDWLRVRGGLESKSYTDVQI